ncbi:inner nuclear membrane protein Man1 isoform X2 [Nematostella vectensis]|uniref:inner nuclear membrane protein Man1 isoform X2 n=1 Tax=Nematostella vectensis TaxID=45351 RepID=UPI0020772215|nr:inner nuclear membrane protein Man1 isoform X2 [Nematostella vectensis]
MAASRLTDAELRQKLKDLGENVAPVTPTTRPLLLKKLKKLQQSPRASPKATRKSTPKPRTPSKGRSPSRKLIGFSSDEEDGDSVSTRDRRSSIRRTNDSDNSRDDSSLIASVSESSRTTKGSVTRTHRTVENSDESHGGEFSDTDSNSYTGPFQRGSFRFRSFRRKKDSPESEKSRQGSILSYPKPQEERPSSSTVFDDPDGFYRRTSAILNMITVFLIVGCVSLLLMYVYQSLPDTGIMQGKALPLCNGNENLSCLPLDRAAEQFASRLYDNLSLAAGLIECNMNESETSKKVSKFELKKKITDYYKSKEDAQKISHRMLELINSKQWGMKLYDKDNKSASPSEAYWIEGTHAYKPILCRLRQSASKIIGIFILVTCVLGILCGIYFLVRHRWRKEEEDMRLMYTFVENIIDILRKHHNACQNDKDLPPYLPIPHVRDMLIKPANRKKLAKTWQRAVRFLSANESRIRVESQRIAGEDFEVWRWIHIASPRQQSQKMGAMGSPKGKFWQGQAFENFQWAVNPPIISPTPCLKIRNMFDHEVEMEEGWHVLIQDAILEKCSDAGANIVHIAVDKSSNEGCVYVKCDSHDSAGIAFKSLHGCWFDGRLVAVKYLTLKRYHQRFPVALYATEALRPSGRSPSSLVTFNPEDQDDQDNNDSDLEV